MGILSKVLSFIPGPVGWLAKGWTAVQAVGSWCVTHWKITISVLALAAALGLGTFEGMKWQGARDQAQIAALEKKIADTAAEEKAIADDHQREVAVLHGVIEAIDKSAAADQKARQAAYGALEKRLNDYAKNHQGEIPAGDVCRAVDIGADGLRLIHDAIAARVLRASGGEGTGTPALPGAGGSDK